MPHEVTPDRSWFAHGSLMVRAWFAHGLHYCPPVPPNLPQKINVQRRRAIVSNRNNKRFAHGFCVRRPTNMRSRKQPSGNTRKRLRMVFVRDVWNMFEIGPNMVHVFKLTRKGWKNAAHGFSPDCMLKLGPGLSNSR